MGSYVRRYWPERRPPRRRRRADPDAARWSYDELDAERRSVRHIVMRADDGTYLAAAGVADVLLARETGGAEAVAEYEARYGTVPQAPVPPLGAGVAHVEAELTADQFEGLWRLARCQLDGSVEVQVHEVRPVTGEGLPVVVRCVAGLVRVGSRLDRVRETGEQLGVTVGRIVGTGGDLDRLRPAHTAVLVLSGVGPARVRAGHHLDGRTG